MGSMSYRGKDRDGREVWELQLSLGYDPDTRSYAKYTERIHGPKTSARRRLRDLERDQDDGKLKAASSQTLGEYLTLCGSKGWTPATSRAIRARSTALRPSVT